MIEALLKIFGKSGKSSREIAHDRLKVVLIHDRLSVSPEVMDKIKTDIIHVISNYVEINQKDMELSLIHISEPTRPY